MSFKISNNDWKKVINYSKYAWDELGSEIGGYMVVIPYAQGHLLTWNLHP